MTEYYDRRTDKHIKAHPEAWLRTGRVGSLRLLPEGRMDDAQQRQRVSVKDESSELTSILPEPNT